MPSYHGITFWQRLHLATILVRLPFVVVWMLLLNYMPRRETSKQRTATKVIRWVSDKCSYQQIAYFMPSTVDVYKRWMNNRRMDIVVEELAEETKLMWVGVGGKRTDRVVLYVPGGALLFPLLDSAISFWHHIRTELEKEASPVGLAILGYSPIPTVSFPMQIRQAMLAVEHIIASGVHPANLQIVGDTSGSHLIFALLSHIMHPLGVDGHWLRKIVPLPGRIRGVYLMSPWVAIGSSGPSSRKRMGLVSSEMRKAYTALLMLGHGSVPDDDDESLGSLLPYLDPSRAPGWWFSPLESVVDRLYMSAGGEESMRDDIIAFSQVLGREMKPNQFVFEVQEGGVCCDPYMDYLGGGGGGGGQLGPLIDKWLGCALLHDSTDGFEYSLGLGELQAQPFDEWTAPATTTSTITTTSTPGFKGGL